MKSPKVDNSGAEAAVRAQAQALETANNLQKNFQADLSNDDISTVTAGGQAEAEGAGTSTIKRKRTGAGVTSNIGF